MRIAHFSIIIEPVNVDSRGFAEKKCQGAMEEPAGSREWRRRDGAAKGAGMDARCGSTCGRVELPALLSLWQKPGRAAPADASLHWRLAVLRLSVGYPSQTCASAGREPLRRRLPGRGVWNEIFSCSSPGESLSGSPCYDCHTGVRAACGGDMGRRTAHGIDV